MKAKLFTRCPSGRAKLGTEKRVIYHDSFYISTDISRADNSVVRSRLGSLPQVKVIGTQSTTGVLDISLLTGRGTGSLTHFLILFSPHSPTLITLTLLVFIDLPQGK